MKMGHATPLLNQSNKKEKRAAAVVVVVVVERSGLKLQNKREIPYISASENTTVVRKE